MCGSLRCLVSQVCPRSGWRRRWQSTGSTTCTCPHWATPRTTDDLNATSLAAVRPAQVDRLEFQPHPGWSSEQFRRFEVYRSQGSLFDEIPLPLLHPPRFRVRLHYRCEAGRCDGHQQTIMDWELTALQARFRRQSDHELQAIITDKFFTNPFGERKEPLIFVGNQEDVRRRAAFTVLGLYYPRRDEAEKGRTLF